MAQGPKRIEKKKQLRIPRQQEYMANELTLFSFRRLGSGTGITLGLGTTGLSSLRSSVPIGTATATTETGAGDILMKNLDEKLWMINCQRMRRAP